MHQASPAASEMFASRNRPFSLVATRQKQIQAAANTFIPTLFASSNRMPLGIELNLMAAF